MSTTSSESTWNALQSQRRLPRIKLMVLRGETRNLDRPIAAPAFLIGAANDCDLVLQADDVPPVHCYLFRNGDECQIRSLGFEPPLLVNGKQVESASLQDGDKLSIGEFELLLRELPQSAFAPRGVISSQDEEADVEMREIERQAKELVAEIVRDVRAILAGLSMSTYEPHLLPEELEPPRAPTTSEALGDLFTAPIGKGLSSEAQTQKSNAASVFPFGAETRNMTSLNTTSLNTAGKVVAAAAHETIPKQAAATLQTESIEFDERRVQQPTEFAEKSTIVERSTPTKEMRVMRADQSQPLRSPLGKPPKFLKLRSGENSTQRRLTPQLRVVNTPEEQSAESKPTDT